MELQGCCLAKDKGGGSCEQAAHRELDVMGGPEFEKGNLSLRGSRGIVTRGCAMVGVEARLLRGGGSSLLYFLTRDNAGEQLVSPDEGRPG